MWGHRPGPVIYDNMFSEDIGGLLCTHLEDPAGDPIRPCSIPGMDCSVRPARRQWRESVAGHQVEE